MKRVLAVIALAFFVSSTVLAGDIPSVPGPQPPPPGVASIAPGDIPSGGITTELSSDALNSLISALSFVVL